MRTISEAMIWAKRMDGKPAPGGPGHCQELVRMAYGLGPWATSAKLAYAHTPPEQMHKGGKPHDAPAGAFVYYPSLSDYGHVTLSLGGGKVLSNDYCKRGYVCICPADLPDWHGVQHYGGWSLWTPSGVAR